MKKIYIIILLLLIMPVSPFMAATKLQKGNNWIYQDNLGNSYNETASSNPFLTSGSNIATINVQTTRPFPFAFYNLTYSTVTLQGQNINVTSEFVFQQGTLAVTQLGSIPIAQNRLFTATFTITENGTTTVYSYSPAQILVGNSYAGNSLINNYQWMANVDPSSVFSTSQPLSGNIDQGYFMNATSNWGFDTSYTLSATTPNPDNYTMQYNSVSFSFNSPKCQFNAKLFNTAIALNVNAKLSSSSIQSVSSLDYSFILSSTSLVPSLITQAQPIPSTATITNLHAKLSASNNHIGNVIYTLQSTKSKTTNLSILPILVFSIMTLVLIRRKKRV